MLNKWNSDKEKKNTNFIHDYPIPRRIEKKKTKNVFCLCMNINIHIIIFI